MREIRFRGKCIEDCELKGQWLYGHYLKSASHFIAVDQGLVDGHFKLYQVDPATVGQYLPVKLRDGKEGAYEGDVVRQLEWGYIARSEIHDLDEFLRTDKVVSYEEDGDFISYYYESGRDVVTLERFRFWLKNESFGWEGEDLWNPKYCEIIGNIHDNPELLKGDENA